MKFAVILTLVATLVCGQACQSRVAQRQAATDHGYKLGTSDAIKRQYWLKQALEARSQSHSEEGKRVYYTFDQPEVAEDGRTIIPKKVTISVIE